MWPRTVFDVFDEETTSLWRLLLELGYDPNELETANHHHTFSDFIPANTPWTTFLEEMYVFPDDYSCCVLALLLQHGADLHAMTVRRSMRMNALMPAWVAICTFPFDPTDSRSDAGEHLPLIRHVLSTGVDLRLLTTAHDHEEPNTAWRIIEAELDSLRIETREQWGDKRMLDRKLYVTSCVLYKLAKAEETKGLKVLPWAEIRPLLRTAYPARLTEALFSIIGPEEDF